MRFSTWPDARAWLVSVSARWRRDADAGLLIFEARGRRATARVRQTPTELEWLHLAGMLHAQLTCC